MKKTYLPFGTFIKIYGAIFLIVLGLFLYFILREGGATPLQIVFLSILVLLVGYYFVSPMIIYIVKIKDKEISIKKDFGLFREDRIQSKVNLNLDDVKEYKVILSDRDSEGKAYASKAQKKMYIEFILNDESKRRIFVSNMSKNQLKKILSDINSITGLEATTE